ncbi:MAG: lipoate--protein ligase [Peptoniphilaceae bacterium]|nr:lipoate--protein ligase [Peptoniphilaceae bacterium]MDD7382969.1 lipoate--protein ligase [Peptoniphilaceae bacterium]MDY3737720.1 lipoate--protein ligase [Peptoniphilaceae bacterium]
MQYYFDNDSTNPFYNHAVEYFFAMHKIPVFILWHNKDAILLGKNQNLYREVNLNYANENGITLVRRLSGGGCIYTDEKNMQYTFVESDDYANDFKHFAQMMIAQMEKMGLNPEFSGRNDILIDGKKISGNAQYIKNSMVVHHGTILFDIDSEKMSKSLTPQKIKFEGKAVKSAASRITTINDMIDMEYDEFFNKIKKGIIEDNKLLPYTLNDEDKEEVMEYKKMFEDHDFIYSKGETSANYQKKHDFGIVEYSYNIKENLLEDFKIEGDFFSKKDISEFCNMFEGKSFTIDEFHNILKKIDINEYIVGMNEKVFLGDIFD